MAEDQVDYTTLSADALADAERAAVAAFDERNNGDVNAAGLAELTELAQAVTAIRGERAARVEAAEQREQLAAMIHGAPGTDGGVEEEDNVQHADGEDPTTADSLAEPERELVTASAPAAVTPVVPVAPRPKTDVRDVLKSGNQLNASLANAQRYVPVAPSQAPARKEPVMVASADIPGFVQGGKLETIMDLSRAVTARARTLNNGSSPMPIASMTRDYAFNLDDQASFRAIEEVLAAVTDESVLTAAGGWCAPSTISYDFYNIVCEDGMLDLPTVGVTRGGIRWPTSPSFGDLAGQVWTWTETQDIAAATGTDQSGVKPCYRVQCPAFNEARLSCDGHCLTAGNLMTDAYPEAIANHLRLLMATQAHYTNARVIQQLVAGSTAVTYTPTGIGVAVPVLDAVEMQVMDYRIKYRMCEGSILEAVFPSWLLPMFRADLAKRMGMNLEIFSVSDGMIADWLTQRGIRAQFVADWQVGSTGLLGQATPATSWPTSVQFLLYAAGTWLRGNGLRLDLGIIRDSTLNATNDYTASWMEECYLTARIGHESRLVTVPICPNGATAAGITFGCTL
jgi:hypothetical protein